MFSCNVWGVADLVEEAELVLEVPGQAPVPDVAELSDRDANLSSRPVARMPNNLAGVGAAHLGADPILPLDVPTT